MKAYYLNEDQSMVLDLVEEIVVSEISPQSETVDHQAVYPEEGVRILAESDLVACSVSEEAGGVGLDAWSQTAVIEGIAKACASTALAVANISMAAELIEKYGTETLRAEVLPQLISGTYACVAGSDANVMASFQAKASVKEEDSFFVLDGTKKWVQRAGKEGYYIVAAADGDQIRWLVVSTEAEGICVKENPAMLGMKGLAFADLIFENCKVSKDMVLTEDVCKTYEDISALYMAAIASGIAQGGLEVAIAYVNERIQFGKTIAQFENTQHVAAELLAKTEAARALIWEAARLKAEGQNYGYTASLAKLAACENASVVTRKCVQFMGGYGFSREYPIERKMRDAKMTELLGGVSSYEKKLIANASVVLS